MKNKKRWYDAAGLFMVMLVLTMPFYSAQSLALVKITANHGSDNIEGFVGGSEDTWTVEAEISGADEQVLPEEVILQIGTNRLVFSSCQLNSGVSSCTYSTSIGDTISERSYPFSVNYQSETVQNEVIIDYSGPKITILGIPKQEGNKILFNFAVEDSFSGKAGSGLALVEVKDVKTGGVLFSKNDFSGRVEKFEFPGELLNDGSNSFQGEGTKSLQVKAVDRLGNENVINSALFNYDFVKPVIKAETLSLVSLGEHIGKEHLISDVTIKIVEKNGLVSVTASSEQAEFPTAAECSRLEEENTWKCLWKNVLVSPSASIKIDIEAADEFMNAAASSKSKTLTLDTTEPRVEYLSTGRVYDGKDYAVSGDVTRIILKLRDEPGSGVDKKSISANLEEIGGAKAAAPSCSNDEKDEQLVICYWDVQARLSGSGNVFIVYYDNVGNKGDAVLPLLPDSVKPIVKNIEFYGGEKDYFQSGDPLIIKMAVEEANGLLVMINVNDLISDAKTRYPKDQLGKDLPAEDGTIVFTQEDSCERVGGSWECVFMTEPMKSGPDTVDIKVEAQDTAGNSANWNGLSGQHKINLLALDENDKPDYWEVSSSSPLIQFIDLDTAQLTKTRMPFKVNLRPLINGVKTLDINMFTSACSSEDPDAPEISRTLVYAGKGAPSATIIMEFAPFDGRKWLDPKQGDFTKKVITYKCSLQIFSEYQSKATKIGEVQEVKVKVPFAFSELGALDENLEELVNGIKKEVWFSITDKIKWVSDIIAYGKYISNLIDTLIKFMEVINGIKAAFDGTRAIPYVGEPVAIAGCASTTAATVPAEKTIIDTYQYITKILSCSPPPKGERAANPAADKKEGSFTASGNWYFIWQGRVLDVYNIVSGRSLLGLEATSIQDNIITSALGICPIGILNNLEKYRQIRCREIICYEQEVPLGITTVSGCKAMGSQLTCEFFYGPLFDLSPLGVLQDVTDLIKSFAESPIGLIKSAAVLLCGLFCPKSGIKASICYGVNMIIKAIDIVDSVAAAFEATPAITADPYCSQVDFGDVKDKKDDDKKEER